MENLVKLFNDKSESFIQDFEFYKKCKFNKLNKISMSVNYISHDDEAFLSVIRSEINQGIIKKITRSLFEADKFNYIDTREVGLDDNFDEILTQIREYSKKYKNIICSGRVGHLFFENHSHFYTSNDVKSYGFLYQVGKLHGVNIWIDPFMSYNDTRIVCFNDINIDINNIKPDNIMNEATFTPKLLFSFDYFFDKGDSNIIYILSSDSSPYVFEEFKRINRDIKINQILNGNS